MFILQALLFPFLIIVARGEVTCAAGAIDLVFVIDQSDSIGMSDYRIGMEAAAHLTERLEIGTEDDKSRVGLVLFDDTATVDFKLTTYSTNQQVAEAIRNAPYSGKGTNIAAGMDAAIRQVFTRDAERAAKRVMIIVTDGADNTNVKAEHDLAIEKGIVTYALGVGKGVNFEQLVKMTGDSENVYNVTDYLALSEVMDQICREVLPSVPSSMTTVAPTIRHSRQCECNYRNTWLDLVFLFDSSNAVGENDFLGIKNFIASFMRMIKISQQRGRYSRVAFVNVGNEARIIANLTSYGDSSSASAAVKRIPHLKSTKVNMFEGLSKAEQILQDKRKNVQSVIVLLTSNPIDCPEEYLTKAKFMRKAVLDDVPDVSSCRLASHLREAGHIIMTIGMKLDAHNFPKINITSPCYSINYDTNIAQQFTNLLCKANCFCLPPYIQNQDESKCEEYGECLYFYDEKLMKSFAEDTCTESGTTVTGIYDQAKEKFVREHHEYFGRTPYWVALSSSDGNGVYHWASGKQLLNGDYTNWGPLQPNPNDGNCVIEENGLWRSAECEDFLNGYYFSCEKNACDTENYCEYGINGA